MQTNLVARAGAFEKSIFHTTTMRNAKSKFHVVMVFSSFLFALLIAIVRVELGVNWPAYLGIYIGF